MIYSIKKLQNDHISLIFMLRKKHIKTMFSDYILNILSNYKERHWNI